MWNVSVTEIPMRTVRYAVANHLFLTVPVPPSLSLSANISKHNNIAYDATHVCVSICAYETVMTLIRCTPIAAAANTSVLRICTDAKSTDRLSVLMRE